MTTYPFRQLPQSHIAPNSHSLAAPSLTIHRTQSDVEAIIWRKLQNSGMTTLESQHRWLIDNHLEDAPELYHQAYQAVIEEIEEHLIAWQVVRPAYVRVLPMEHCSLAVTSEPEGS